MLPEIEKAVDLMQKQQEATDNLNKFLYELQDILYKYAKDEDKECRLVTDAIIVDVDEIAKELLGYEGFAEQCYENETDSSDVN